MQLVDHLPPGVEHCAVTDQLLSQKDAPFVDSLLVLPFVRPRVVLSVQGAIEAGRAVGMAERKDHESLLEERDSLFAEIERLKAELFEASEFEGNVRYTLEHFDKELRIKPGPRPGAKK